MDIRIATALATIDTDAADTARLLGTPLSDPAVPAYLIPALEALTALPGETREQHLDRICDDPTARLVALAENSLKAIDGTPDDDERKRLLSHMDINGRTLTDLGNAFYAAA